MSYFSIKCLVLVGIAIVLSVVMSCFAAIPQPQSIHLLADQRSFLGIPNALNVLSNVPFLCVSVVGLFFLARSYSLAPQCVGDPREKLFYWIFFIAMIAVCFGSSDYHWHPDNQRLVWDRVPITLVFMAFFSAMIAERVNVSAARYLLWPLLLLGVVSVFYWHYTETIGAGDLRIYILIQVIPLILIPMLLMMFKSRYTHTFYVWLALICYLLAKVFEYYDHGFYQLTRHIISGHTLKHLAAAMGAYYIYRYLRIRQVSPLK